MKFVRIVHVILLCQQFPTEVFGQGSQRVSMQCVNMQCDIENAQGNFPHVQGKIGPKGEVGPRGLPGRVDYERINSTTDEKIKSGLESLLSNIVQKLDEKEDSIQALRKEFSLLPSREVLENLFSQITDQLNEKEEKIQSLQEQLSSLTPHVRNLNATDDKIKILQKRGICDFVYKGTCYWIEIHDFSDTNYEEAESICNKRNSVLSYPVDETHYELIMKEMRSKIPSGKTSVYAWTGLKINPSTGFVTLATGKSAPYVKWGPGDPDRGSTDTKVYMWANEDPNANSEQGLYDLPPSSNRYGAICQYKF